MCRWNRFFLVIATTGLTACSTPATHNLTQPDLVPLTQIAPDIQQDMRYFSHDNFIGRPIEGYHAPHCWLSRDAAQALARVQQRIRQHGASLIVFDCYRPQQAVDDFVRWGKDLNDQRMKSAYYPDVPKETLFERGYIAEKSGHSRASTVDLGLVVIQPDMASAVIAGPIVAGHLVDMGTPFDFFDVRSHTDHPNLPRHVRNNRDWLRHMMQQEGWRNLPEEWWHFTLNDEPYPDRYFSIPVR